MGQPNWQFHCMFLQGVLRKSLMENGELVLKQRYGLPGILETAVNFG